MKHLKSSSTDLRRLFQAITIREIAEPLASFDVDCDAGVVKAFMDARNFDVVGLRENGGVAGYVRRQNLRDGSIRSHMNRFTEHEVVAESEPLSTAIEKLPEQKEIFIRLLGHVGAIVTKGDLQKAPVRLWLFGLISLLEMQMLRLLGKRFPNGQWTSLVPVSRLEAAKRLFAERKRRNEEAASSDFADCLQICDKAAILLKDSELSVAAGFASREAGQKFFSALELLRNDLAHANDILNGRWPGLAGLVKEGERLLVALEAYGSVKPKE